MPNYLLMRKQLHVWFLVLLFFVTIPFFSACSGSRRSGCQADRTYQQRKYKKNRSNYTTKFGVKQNSPRKDYVFRNRRR